MKEFEEFEEFKEFEEWSREPESRSQEGLLHVREAILSRRIADE